jgi:hypothetical protein
MERHPSASLATSAEIHTDERGDPLQIQFLFGKDVLLIPGQAMLERMARGEGFGGNSSFFIRAEAYRGVGGYDGELLYAADYELAARLCQIGDYLHTDEPLFYGRSHPLSSSSVDPGELWDVLDRFAIADRTFRPRPLLTAQWRRYQMLSGLLTARYVLNVLLQHLRGNHANASRLSSILLRHGNFWIGLPFLLIHAPIRVFDRLTHRGRRRVRRPLPSMGRPASWPG